MKQSIKRNSNLKNKEKFSIKHKSNLKNKEKFPIKHKSNLKNKEKFPTIQNSLSVMPEKEAKFMKSALLEVERKKKSPLIKHEFENQSIRQEEISTHPYLSGNYMPSSFSCSKTTKGKISKGLMLIGATIILALKVYLFLFYLDIILGIYSFLTSIIILSCFYVSYLGYKDPVDMIKSEKFNKITSKDAMSFDKDHSDGRKPDTFQPFVSVVIAVKDDPVMISATIDSILKSTYTELEVIVADDGSTDDTPQILDQMQRKYPEYLRIIHLEKNQGKRKAMREGILRGNAKGDVIVVVDSDCILESHAIEKLIKTMYESDVGAVCGIARGLNAQENHLTKMQDTWYDGQFCVTKAFEAMFNTVTCCPGVLSAYRRECIMPCLEDWANDQFLNKPFMYGDDRHLTSFVMGGNKHKYGPPHKTWKVKFCESSIVYTELPTKWMKFIKQQIRWKKSWFRVFFFTAPFYFKDRNPFAAVMYYLQMIWSLMAPIIIIRAIVILPLQGEWLTSSIYISGIVFIGLLYSIDFRLRNPHSGNKWVYRLLWSFVGFFLNVLEYYSILTIRSRSWMTR